MTNRQKPDEFELIARYLAPLARGEQGALELLDDAAILDIPAGRQLVVCADALIENVHFLGNDPPELIGRKALRVNLSDLAAMGAVPFAYLLTMALPEDGAATWVEAFARGLELDQEEFGVTLVGGDTTSTKGPISLSVTAMGHIARGSGIRRSGAQAGDLIFVSGKIGDSALGLKLLGGSFPWMAKDEQSYLINRYRLPEPRVELGQRLQGLVSAAIDISDGLAGDLAHICAASGLGAEVAVASVPMSAATRKAVENDADNWNFVLGGGDDYELLFTASPDQTNEIDAVAKEVGVPVTQIGSMKKGEGVRILGLDGQEMTIKKQGYRHF